MTEQELKRQLIHKLREGLSKDYDALYVKEYSTMWETERFLRKSELNIMSVDNALNSILSLLSARIKAKALTNEQIADAVLRADDDYNKNHLSQKNDGFNFHQVQNNRRKFIAVARLQAVLGEIDLKEQVV